VATWMVADAGHLSSAGDTCALIAVYTIATQRSWRQTVVAGIIASVTALPATLLQGRPVWEAALIVPVYGIMAGVVAAVGLYLGKRRALVSSLIERTLHLQRERDALERERDLMARQAVAVERARIARELHDVVAHHVSVMVIQAGAAEASLPPNAAASAQAIGAVRETGREALAEMRRLLGLLRSDSTPDAGDGDGADMTPQPGLTDLASLAERTREAGVDVATEVVGAARKLPAGVDLSLYRVVQEALTNTLRHAGPGAKARLRISYTADSVTVEITDDGRGKPAVATVERGRQGVGHGLLGMRERVALFGGRLETGPLPGGGFKVKACFPVEFAQVGQPPSGVDA
jgi:signal transduction histidine kinase